MAISFVEAFLVLLIFCNFASISTGESMRDRLGTPLPKVNGEISDLKTTQNTIQAEMTQTTSLVNTLSASLAATIKCINVPHIEGATVSISTTITGNIVATYSCTEGYAKIAGSNLVSTCEDGSWTAVDLKCSQYKDCYRNINGQGVYGGKMDMTKTGKRCQAWAVTYPHDHSYTDAHFSQTNLFPESAQSVSNYCRDPDMEGTTWCYTVESTRWEHCMIPPC